MHPELGAILKKQGYALVGNHSAVKLCHWLRSSLLYDRQCYKHTFYGIASHRCLQMTPAVMHCTQKCLFCWRFQGFTLTQFDQADDPSCILDESLKEQYRLLTGFKGDDRCSQKKWEEAIHPVHVACSLSGEPTLYPNLGPFFAECHKRGMTTFLVTNGTCPDVLENIDPLPTQLYVTLAAPTKKIYQQLCVPLIPNAWEKINETLALLPSLSTRTVIRHTLVNGWNIGWEKEYAKLDSKANPLFIEPKGYVFVGYSRQRMHIEHMPSHETIKRFGEKLSHLLGYPIAKERKESRVLLLTRDAAQMKLPC